MPVILPAPEQRTVYGDTDVDEDLVSSESEGPIGYHPEYLMDDQRGIAILEDLS